MTSLRVTFQQREDNYCERTETIVMDDDWNVGITDGLAPFAQIDSERFAIEMVVKKTYGSVIIVRWEVA
jgi:hypothetical protein